MEGPDKISAGTGGMENIDGSGAGRAGPENGAVTWEKLVDDIFIKNSNCKDSETIEVMTTPIALCIAGAEALPLRMSVAKLRKIAKPVTGGGHGITIDVIKRLPDALDAPVMIFSSVSMPGSMVAVTELKDSNGATVVAPIHLHKQRTGNAPMNWLASIYGKVSERGTPKHEWFVSQIKHGNLRYIDTKKSSLWITSSRLQLPKGVTIKNLSQIVPTEENLVKRNSGTNAERTSHIRHNKAFHPGQDSSAERDRLAEARAIVKQHFGGGAVLTSAQPGRVYSGEIIGVLDAPLNSAVMAVSDSQAILHDFSDAAEKNALKPGETAELAIDWQGYSAAWGRAAAEQPQKREQGAKR